MLKHLHDGGHDEREHGEGEPEQVEEGQGHEGLLRVQDVIWVRKDVDGEGCQRDLKQQETFWFHAS